ncbi:hypothetical protein AB4353_14325 [Vibrio breoganii]
MKNLSTGGADSFYSNIGVINYGYVYALVLSTPFMLKRYICESKSLKRIYCFFLLILTLLFIYSTGFMTALLLVIIGMYLVILFSPNNKHISIVTVFCILVLVLFIGKGDVADLLAVVSSKVEVYSLKERIIQIQSFLVYGDMGDTLERFELYAQSLQLFISSPLYGSLLSGGTYSISGHSEVLDTLAHGGLILLTPFLLFHMYYFFWLLPCSSISYRSSIYAIIVMYFILSTINTTFSSQAIWCFIFIVLPTLVNYYHQGHDRESSLAL